MSQETYLQARIRIMRELVGKGWKTSSLTLKRPWAEHPTSGYRITFRAQATYLEAHSLFCDIRGMSVEILIHHADEFYHYMVISPDKDNSV